MVPNAEHSLSPWYLKIGQTVASWSTLLLEVDISSQLLKIAVLIFLVLIVVLTIAIVDQTQS